MLTINLRESEVGCQVVPLARGVSVFSLPTPHLRASASSILPLLVLVTSIDCANNCHDTVQITDSPPGASHTACTLSWPGYTLQNIFPPSASPFRALIVSILLKQAAGPLSAHASFD